MMFICCCAGKRLNTGAWSNVQIVVISHCGSLAILISFGVLADRDGSTDVSPNVAKRR